MIVVVNGERREMPEGSTVRSLIEELGLSKKACAAEVNRVLVAVRRERLFNEQGKSLLEFLDLSRYTILPNTAGCFAAADAVRVARLGREILTQLGNPGANWVKIEVLGDKKTLLPDPLGTI